MKIAVIAMTGGGRKLAARLVPKLPGAVLESPGPGIAATMAALWREYDGFVMIMAAGIVVRAVAPLLGDKRSDPAVVVVDERGQFAVSLLSGHLGGGNELARRVAAILGGRPVLTTASDVLGLVPLDLWARSQDLVPRHGKTMIRASALLVNNGSLRLYAEVPVAALPAGLVAVDRPEEADLVISSRTDWPGNTLVFHPRELVVGVGCNRSTPVHEFVAALDEVLADRSLSPLAVRNLASIDLKHDEEGLREFAALHGWEIVFYTKEELNRVAGITVSPAVLKATGAQGVAEPAALLSARTDILLMEKKKWPNLTLALARAKFTLSALVREDCNT